MAKDAANDPAFQEIALLFEELIREDAASITTNKFVPSGTGPVTVTSPKDDQVSRLKAYRESLSNPATHKKQKAIPKALFSGNQKESISQLAEEVAQEEEQRRIEEERRRQEEERKRREEEERRRQEEERRRREAERQRRLQDQLADAMRSLSGKSFSSHQEARRFFMNLIAGLPEEVARKITDRGMGWRCNAYDCVHNSPGDCADPSRGGLWMIR